MNEESSSQLDPVKVSKPRKAWLDWLNSVLSDEPQNREDVLNILRAAQQRDLLQYDALVMIEGVFEIMDDQVRDIMIPRSHMVVIEHDADLPTILQTVISSGHSRFPVIGDNRDEVVGVLLAKDLLQYTSRDTPFDIQDMIRPAVLIPESKRLNILLKEFRANRHHMAIIVDEYGGIAGLITIEDVLEQIVGDITDEYDNEEDQHIRPDEMGGYLVKALTEIEEFNEYFSAELDDQEFDTIGGLILGQLGHLPKVDEELSFAGFHFKIINADSRRIHRILVTRIESADSELP